MVPASACIPMPASIPSEIAALTEPLACVYNASRKAGLVPGDDVVIFGGGAIYDFALVLFIGILVGTYSSIYVATPVMLMWHREKKPEPAAPAKGKPAKA